MALGAVDWVAFDLETTGLPSTSWPVEIGARRFHPDGSVTDFQTLVDPGVPIPAAVVRIHGITDEAVRGAPAVAEAVGGFLRFADGACLVAHNAAFDAGILGSAAARCKINLPDVAIHDSVRIARRLLPHLWSYRLSALRRVLRLETGAEHRALPDAQAVGLLMERLLGLGSRDLCAFPFSSPGHLGSLRRFLPDVPFSRPEQNGDPVLAARLKKGSP